MKLTKLTLSLITFLCTFSISQSQDLWDNINLPDGLNSDITCVVAEGNDIFIGTNMGGIHYSSNKGSEWTHLNHKLIDQDIIQNIYLSPNGYIFAIGEKIIYRSNRKQFSWEAFNFFQQKQEVINCSDMSIEGDLAVGTDIGIYKSSAALNGSQWSNITGNLEKIKVTKVKFDAFINLFICTYRKEQYSIFILQTRNWEEVINGIKQTPNVNYFALDQKPNMFAAIGNSFMNSIIEAKHGLHSLKVVKE